MFVNVPEETIIRFFNSVSTLISNNFRSLVFESLKHYVNFFERFSIDRKGSTVSVNSYTTEETIQQRCAFRLDLLIVGPFRIDVDEDEEDISMGLKDDVNKECTIEFKSSIADIQNCVLELFDRMARSLNGIPRVENHIGSLKLSAPNDI